MSSDFSKSELEYVMYKHAIQEKPKEKEHTKETQHYLVIDSRLRNIDRFPNQHTYEVELNECLEEICGIEIIKANVPFSQYKINDHNNMLHFEWDGVQYSVKIFTGEYFGDPNEAFLATELRNRMNAEVTNTDYNRLADNDSIKNPIDILYDPIKDQIVFRNKSSNDPKPSFKIIAGDGKNYKKNSLARILGMKPKEYSQNNQYYIIPDYRNQFEKDPYIIMNLYVGGRNANVIESSLGEDDEIMSLRDAFAIIDRNEANPNRGSDLSNTNNEILPLGKTFPTKINRMDKIRIEFRDFYGNSYDFQNKDHRLEFIVRTNEKGLRNDDLSTRFLYATK